MSSTKPGDEAITWLIDDVPGADGPDQVLLGLCQCLLCSVVDLGAMR